MMRFVKVESWLKMKLGSESGLYPVFCAWLLQVLEFCGRTPFCLVRCGFGTCTIWSGRLDAAGRTGRRRCSSFFICVENVFAHKVNVASLRFEACEKHIVVYNGVRYCTKSFTAIFMQCPLWNCVA